MDTANLIRQVQKTQKDKKMDTANLDRQIQKTQIDIDTENIDRQIQKTCFIYNLLKGKKDYLCQSS